ncbi:putative addiction module antidote protein, CC2985 family [Methylobacterium sp. ap11]|uniref:ribbon-helix-helix domain-containing protein n=1 Tax=Methylobacterium sp. ap11 TaxID=1761799 RepID=UPI0008B470D3|nr:type II toxin-antitoxin system ParD family antitoxin [Methylobacterium sp. ap11]SEP38735.1 putative addiction module antidote protein, CC2985 family [Methylobacterium sp. ap11]
MSATTERTFSLPDERSHSIDTVVASGTCASGSEVVRAGLRALQERDAAVETWLRDEVVRTCDAMTSDPGRARSVDDVRAGLQALHAARLRDAER